MQKLRELLRRKMPTSIEAPPIKSQKDIEDVIGIYKGLGLKRYFEILNIPSNPLGRPSSDPGLPAYILKEKLGISPIIHVPYGSDTHYSLVGRLIEYSIGEVEGLLLISGDVRMGDLTLDEVLKYVEMIGKGVVILNGNEIRIHPWEFVVGGALIQYRESETDKILYKTRRGLEFFQTQITFDKDPLYRVCAKLSDVLDREISILIGFAPSIHNTPGIIGSILGRSGSKLLSMDRDSYIDHIAEVAGYFIDTFKGEPINIGIHVFPLKWSEESINTVLDFLGRIGLPS